MPSLSRSLSFFSPDPTSEQIVASDQELGLTELHQQQLARTHFREHQGGLHKSPDIGGTRESAAERLTSNLSSLRQRTSSHPSPRAAMIRPPQLIAHSSQGKRAPTPCHDRAGAWAGPRQADLSNFRQGFSGERVLAGWHRLPVDRSAPVMMWQVVLRK